MTAVRAIDSETFAAPTLAAPSENELVRANLPLVGHLVRELLTRLPAHVNRDDLVSAGMMALVTSARSYDESRGVPFGRFAAIRIRGALTDELRGMDWASRTVRGKAREMDAVRNELTARLGRSPRREEIAQVMGVSVHDLDGIDADVQRAAVLSIHGLAENDGAGLLPSADENPEGLIMRREQLGLLRDAIAELPDRLRTVVEQSFFAQRKMTDIADELGVTESRVSQLRSEALRMLREGLRAQDADQFDAAPESTGRRDAARAAYSTAIASRSSLAGRLQASSLLGEATAVVAAQRVRQAI